MMRGARAGAPVAGAHLAQPGCRLRDRTRWLLSGAAAPRTVVARMPRSIAPVGRCVGAGRHRSRHASSYLLAPRPLAALHRRPDRGQVVAWFRAGRSQSAGQQPGVCQHRHGYCCRGGGACRSGPSSMPGFLPRLCRGPAAGPSLCSRRQRGRRIANGGGEATGSPVRKHGPGGIGCGAAARCHPGRRQYRGPGRSGFDLPPAGSGGYSPVRVVLDHGPVFRPTPSKFRHDGARAVPSG